MDDFIILQIEDNGIGINEKDINKVFNKSFTEKMDVIYQAQQVWDFI